MKVLLINPPFYRFFLQKSSYFPKGLGRIARVVEDHEVEIKIYNADCEDTPKPYFHNEAEVTHYPQYVAQLFNEHHPVYNELRTILRDYQPDVVGISASTSALKSALTTAKICKDENKDMKTVLGGIHPTCLSVESPYLDEVITGPGEEPFLNYITGTREQIPDVIPAYHTVIDVKRPHLQYGRIMTAFGCPFHCSFCVSHKMWSRKLSFRGIENIMEEINLLYHTYHIRSFCFDDDTFTLNKKYVTQLCERLIEENLGINWWCETRVEGITEDLVDIMKLAGCSTVAIGVESGSAQVLDSVHKQLKTDEVLKTTRLFQQKGILVDAFFMYGFPNEGPEEIQETIDFLKRMNPHYAWLAIVVPYPGTELFESYSDVLPYVYPLTPEYDWHDFIHINLDMAYLLNFNFPQWQSRQESARYIMRTFDQYNHTQHLHYGV